MSISQLPSGSYRVQIRQKGKPRFDVVRSTLEVAQAEEAAEFARRASAVPAGARMTLADAAAAYLESSMYEEKKPTTRRQERQLLVPVVAGMGSHTLEHIANNRSLVVAYRDARRKTISERTKRKIGEGKVRVEICALSSIFLWAVENGYFPFNPIVGIRRGKSPETERRLSPTESTTLKLIAERGKREDDKQIARFLLIQLELICRPGELAQVLLSDIDLSESDTRFRDTKNGTDRLAHVPPAAVSLIAEQQVYAAIHGGPYLFSTVGRDGQHVAYNYAWQIRRFKKLRYLGKDFVAHCIRSEGVTRGFEAGIPATILLLMTGHKSLVSVERYKKKTVMADSARDAIDQHSREMLLAADAHVNTQLPPNLTLARAQHMFAALPPDIQRQFLASHLPE